MSIISMSVAAVVALGPLGGSVSAPILERPSMQVASVCFGAGEQVSGMNKICYYKCITGTVAITIKSYQLCPLTIDN
jgi:hypothetical protein